MRVWLTAYWVVAAGFGALESARSASARRRARTAQQHLLEGAEIGARGLRLAADLVAQFTLQALERCGIAAPQRDPQQQQQAQREQRGTIQSGMPGLSQGRSGRTSG